MLSSRTKQINAYGKRGRRIIDATADSLADLSAVPSTGIISIFDALPPPPQSRHISSKMKGRENVVPQKSRTTSVKIVGLQKKKRLSPVLSPIQKKQMPRVTQIMVEELGKSKVPASKVSSKTAGTERLEDSVLYPRAPLSPVVLNMAGSPGISRDVDVQELKPTNRSTKLFSPFVDVKITILDDKGRTICTEKRASPPKRRLNPPPKKLARSKASLCVITAYPASDGEDETCNLPRAGKRQVPRRRLIVESDESEHEEECMSMEVKNRSSKRKTNTLKASVPNPKYIIRPKSIVEVIVPPAPYKLPHLLPQTKPPSPPPLSRDDLDVQSSRISTTSTTAIQFISPQRYHFIPSPTLKARQLTPINAGHTRFFEPPSPPSPTTPTDFDLSIDFSDLTSGSGVPLYPQDFEVPEYLRPLLNECNQEASGPHNFSAFIDSFPYDPILQAARENKASDMQFKKIGEASYSEVFGIGDVVLKVIPIRDETKLDASSEEGDGPAPSDAKDVRKEIIVTKAMGEVYDGFVRLLKTYVVRGKYPEKLLRLWDEYNERKGSDSVRPDTFKVSQIYAIIVLPNGGPDLETYTFRNSSRTGWRQACSLFWQVAKALAHAEHLVSFEHRDLHWGQILVKDLPIQANVLRPVNINQKTKEKAHLWMDDPSYGVQATIIDLGLSRMDAGDGGSGDRVHWTPFDEEVFMGEGDYQFDIYRMMRDLTQHAWEKFHPTTNVLWLHYLLQKLLYSKGLKIPTMPRKTKNALEAPSPSHFALSEKTCYECLLDLEKWLRISVSGIASNKSVAGLKGKKKSKTQPRLQPSITLGPARAGEIIAYGVKKRWIEPTILY